MESSIQKLGSIHVICGCMYSGKTEELERRIRRVRIAQKKFLVFKHSSDTRYSFRKLANHHTKHNGQIESIGVSSATQIYQILLKEIHSLPEYVFIDEAQFFDQELVEVCKKLAYEMNTKVVVAGLDLDFRGEPFGSMPTLLALAEEVVKLTAICVVCGSEATRTQRLIGGLPADYDDPIILVGAHPEGYEARCVDHHDVPKHSTIVID